MIREKSGAKSRLSFCPPLPACQGKGGSLAPCNGERAGVRGTHLHHPKRFFVPKDFWPGAARRLAPFFCLPRRKRRKKRAPHFAGLRLPSAASLKPGNAETRFAFNFKGSEAQTSALLLTGLSLPSAAAQRGNAKSKTLDCHGPAALAMTSFRGGNADEAIQLNSGTFTSRLSAIEVSPMEQAT